MKALQAKNTIWFKLLSGIVIGTVIIILVPDYFQKYKIEITEKVNSKDRNNYYHDFDKDGFSEYILLYKDRFIETPALCIYPPNKRYSTMGAFFQSNLKRNLVNNAEIIFADFDNNNLDELFFFTISNDSLFIEMSIYPSDKVKSKYVGQACIKNGVEDFEIFNGSPLDLNNDGYQEILFVVSGAYCGIHRYICAFDIANDTILKSPEAYFNMRNVPSSYYDSTIKRTYITMPTGGTQNYQGVSDKLTDQCSYLVVFDENLNFAFEPISNQGYTSYVVPHFVENNDSTFIYSRHSYFIDSIPKFKIALYDLLGHEVISRKISTDIRSFGSFISRYNNKDHLYTQRNAKFITEYNFDLNPIHTIELPFEAGLWRFIDLDMDGEDEILFYDRNSEKLFITRANITKPVDVSLNFDPPFHITIKKYGPENSYLAINTKEQLLIYRYYQNPIFYYKFPIYTLLILLIYLLIFTYDKLVNEKKLRNEKELNKLQYASLKNQIDPHFMLNILNSISGMYGNKRHDEADKYMVRFSRLIQQSLMNNNKISVSLKEELEFSRNFIEVQKTRFSNCFEYSIEVDEGVNTNREIPRMLVHSFVENAIKHGLVPKKANGLLSIRVKNSSKSYLITIEDNGLGLQKTSKTSGTGKGIVIVDQILDLYRKLSGKRISYKITDLSINPGSGTLVEITLPD